MKISGAYKLPFWANLQRIRVAPMLGVRYRTGAIALLNPELFLFRENAYLGTGSVRYSLLILSMLTY